MNERLNELVDLFLHRGLSPDQEKEWFDACLSDRDAAATVRQQLILSLKIRQLRDQVEVPNDVRNDLFRKINAIEVDETEEKERKPLFGWLGGLHLGWSHAAVAGATAVALLFILDGSEPAADLQQQMTEVHTVPDTVQLISTDTVREVRTVRVPVYREQNTVAENLPADAQDVATDATDLDPAGIDLAENSTDQNTDAIDVTAQRIMQVHRGSYMEQYSATVASTEKVHLTGDDRVRL